MNRKNDDFKKIQQIWDSKKKFIHILSNILALNFSKTCLIISLQMKYGISTKWFTVLWLLISIQQEVYTHKQYKCHWLFLTVKLVPVSVLFRPVPNKQVKNHQERILSWVSLNLTAFWILKFNLIIFTHDYKSEFSLQNKSMIQNPTKDWKNEIIIWSLR